MKKGKVSMRYYMIQTHPLFLNSIEITGWREEINKDCLCLNEFYKVPERSAFPVKIGEGIPFPDIITIPFLMVSELVYKVIKMYGDMIYTRDVILMDSVHDIYMRYYLVVFDNTEDRGAPIPERNIFYKNINGTKRLLVSLDFAESILRRGAIGIELCKFEF